jgi:hypothetical protein
MQKFVDLKKFIFKMYPLSIVYIVEYSRNSGDEQVRGDKGYWYSYSFLGERVRVPLFSAGEKENLFIWSIFAYF